MADQVLDDFRRDILVDIEEELISDPFAVHEASFREVASGLETVEKLLRRFLADDAIDPFPGRLDP